MEYPTNPPEHQLRMEEWETDPHNRKHRIRWPPTDFVSTALAMPAFDFHAFAFRVAQIQIAAFFAQPISELGRKAKGH